MTKVLVPSSSGGHVVNIDAIAGAHWEGKGERRKLFVHYLGGRFESFDGAAAESLWRVISESAEPVESEPACSRSA